MTNNRIIQVAKHARSRWKAKTPSWFRLIITVGLSISTVCTTIVLLPIKLSDTFTHILCCLIIVGSVASAVAKTAVENE
jgi:hypothetical protein